ncbi:hypothetical protein LguiA_026069 [Lonicera macranthoides]
MFIQSIISWFSHSSYSWGLTFSENFNDREGDEFISLLNSIDTIRFNHEVSDKRIWVGQSSGEFSCKSFFDILSYPSSNLIFPQFSIIWKGGIPTKIKLFAGLASLGKVSTCDLVQVRRPFISLSLSIYPGVFCVGRQMIV